VATSFSVEFHGCFSISLNAEIAVYRKSELKILTPKLGARIGISAKGKKMRLFASSIGETRIFMLFHLHRDGNGQKALHQFPRFFAWRCAT